MRDFCGNLVWRRNWADFASIVNKMGRALWRTGMDVSKTKVDVIGGHAGTTIMPLLSQVLFNVVATWLLHRVLCQIERQNERELGIWFSGST